MRPSEIRADLLGQHAGLRLLIADARRAVDDARTRESARSDLRDCIQRLTTALRLHNQREEALLRDIIRKVDAWGPARAEIMDESHVEEHMELLAALLGTNGASDARAAADGVVPVLDRLEEHIAHEEQVLLAEDLLRDDDVVIEYFGG